jgi:hypothetical protein
VQITTQDRDTIVKFLEQVAEISTLIPPAQQMAKALRSLPTIPNPANASPETPPA